MSNITCRDVWLFSDVVIGIRHWHQRPWHHKSHHGLVNIKSCPTLQGLPPTLIGLRGRKPLTNPRRCRWRQKSCRCVRLADWPSPLSALSHDRTQPQPALAPPSARASSVSAVLNKDQANITSMVKSIIETPQR